MKLSLEQKAYLASIDSEKKRKKQNKEFKLQNLLFGNDMSESIESVVKKISEINDANFEKEYKKIECIPGQKKHFLVVDGLDYEIEDPMDLSFDFPSFKSNNPLPKCKTTENIKSECNNDYGEFFNTKKNDSTLTKGILQDLTEPKSAIQKSREYCKKALEENEITYRYKKAMGILRPESIFTLDDLESAFKESRIYDTQSGYKYSSFASYLNYLEQ